MVLDTGVTLTMSNLFTLFPTLIYKDALSEHAELKKKYVPELIELFKQQPDKKAPWAKFCNSWQDNEFFVNNPDKRNLLEDAITPHIHKWFKRYNLSSFDYKITYWFNVHTSDMYQETHDHMLGHLVVCGIYYLQLSEEDTPVVFVPHQTIYQSHLRNIGITHNHEELAFDSSDILKIKEGDLILFAPDSKHLAPKAKQKHKGYRISLAFNVAVTRPFIPSGTHEN